MAHARSAGSTGPPPRGSPLPCAASPVACSPSPPQTPSSVPATLLWLDGEAMEGGTMDLGSSTPALGRRDRSASSWPPGTATPPPPPPAMAPSSPPNGKEFLMQKNTLKRPRSPDGDHTLALGNFEGSANEAAKILDVMDTRPSLDNSNRKKKAVEGVVLVQAEAVAQRLAIQHS